MSVPRLVILDRDGVINQDSDDYIKSPAEWQPIAGSLDAIAQLHRAGFQVMVVSNQSGLARGLFDADTLDAIHAKMLRRVQASGGRIDGIFFCPHHPDEGCGCRKPEPGMIEQLEAAVGASVRGCAFVGDRESDLELARRVGCVPILVRTGNGAATEANADTAGVIVLDDLAAVARELVSPSA